MAKLGTDKKPAILRVATEKRAMDLHDFCDRKGWKVVIGIEPDEQEDLADLQRLMGEKAENTKTVVKEEKIGRNDPCPCGSGKKHKKCCG
ncbi:SEC-C domain-containing protein [Salicibibacter cibarius]|uniref:SEC-C domain-containing protein n=1 Tax=Salicibibacter cibarius TaxID=2743000 RepID=A0A7T7CAG0_9BACI|nr:SEC-C domain-containing protein [Salicibibacter cibarius]